MWHMTLAPVPARSQARIARLQRLEAVLGDHVLGHAHLDADHHVGVLGDGPGAGVDLRVVDVVELGHREGGEPACWRCAQRRRGACAGLRRDVAAEGREVVRAGIARRDQVVVPWKGTSSSAGMPMAEP